MNSYKVRLNHLPLKKDAKEGEFCRENVATELQIKAFKLGYKWASDISNLDTYHADSLALSFESSGRIGRWSTDMTAYDDWRGCKEITWQEFLALPEPEEEAEEKPYHEYPEGSLFEIIKPCKYSNGEFKVGDIVQMYDKALSNDTVSIGIWLPDKSEWFYVNCDSIRPYKCDRPETPKPKTINRNDEMIGCDYREPSKMELEYSAKVYEQSKQAVVEQKEYPATALVETDLSELKPKWW